jgi:hypothetical protein
VVKEVRTNTPLQALDLMNDPIFLEAARSLAARMLREGGVNPAARIAYGFELATARPPTAREAEILLDGFRYHHQRFEADRDAANRYLDQAGGIDNASELAALSTVASIIMNLDQTVTKE